MNITNVMVLIYLFNKHKIVLILSDYHEMNLLIAKCHEHKDVFPMAKYQLVITTIYLLTFFENISGVNFLSIQQFSIKCLTEVRMFKTMIFSLI